MAENTWFWVWFGQTYATGLLVTLTLMLILLKKDGADPMDLAPLIAVGAVVWPIGLFLVIVSCIYQSATRSPKDG